MKTETIILIRELLRKEYLQRDADYQNEHAECEEYFREHPDCHEIPDCLTEAYEKVCELEEALDDFLGHSWN